MDVIPNADMVKFEKSGSNAVTAAVRAARGYTKKEKIAYCGSGGVWHDWQAAMVSRDGGVPKFNAELNSSNNCFLSEIKYPFKPNDSASFTKSGSPQLISEEEYLSS